MITLRDLVLASLAYCSLNYVSTLRAVEYQFEVVLSEGDPFLGQQIFNLNWDNAPPHMNNRGDVAFLARTPQGTSLFVRDAQGDDRRVYGQGDWLSRPSDGRVLRIPGFDGDDFSFGINQRGIVVSSDQDDLVYTAVNDQLIVLEDDVWMGQETCSRSASVSLSGEIYRRYQLCNWDYRDFNQDFVVVRDDQVIARTGDLIDGNRLEQLQVIFSPSGREGILSTYIPAGSPYKDFHEYYTALHLGPPIGFFFEDRFYEGFGVPNDSGQVMHSRYIYGERIQPTLEVFVDNELRVSSDWLRDPEGRLVHSLTNTRLTSDGNIISKAYFQDDQSGHSSAFYFNDQVILRPEALEIDGQVYEVFIDRHTTNWRGDLAFIARFPDGVDRIVVGKRQVSALPGDVNQDNVLDLEDVRLISEALREPQADLVYDLNRDGVVNDLDLTRWVRDLKGTYFGDADLNGQFNSADLVRVFTRGRYEDGQQANVNWLNGDWTGDGLFNSQDLVRAFQDGGYEQGPRVLPGAVPEPWANWLLLLALPMTRMLAPMRTGRRR